MWPEPVDQFCFLRVLTVSYEQATQTLQEVKACNYRREAAYPNCKDSLSSPLDRDPS